MRKYYIITSLFWMLSYYQASAQTFTFDFSQGSQLFVGGVSDFGVNQSAQHEFTFRNEELPDPFPPGQFAQYISGINPSDDLFMYAKRKITGLKPNTSFRVQFIVEFASIYPTNAFGVGGPPGEGVTMKAGVTLIEPDTLIGDEGGPYVLMNIDKGNQSQPGLDMDTIGHVGVSDTTTVYALKTNDNITHPFSFTTDDSGEAWFIVGTDSGFESTTAIYYTHIEVQFSETTSTKDPDVMSDFVIYPNPSSGQVHIKVDHGTVEKVEVYDMMGRLFQTTKQEGRVFEFDLPPGEYVLTIISRDSTSSKRLTVH